MANVVVMPKQGNTVESCIIVEWKKNVGETIAVGDILCEVETDKATLEVESTAAGTLLALFFAEGDEVPVLTPIAAVGESGEDMTGFCPGERPHLESAVEAAQPAETAMPPGVESGPAQLSHEAEPFISPRAKKLARQRGLDFTDLAGSGPEGRIIERDVEAFLARRPSLTPVASRMLSRGEYAAPDRGTGAGGRITARDLLPAVGEPPGPAGESLSRSLTGIRKVIAERMLSSLQTTAQLTLNASADARALLAYRQKLKASPEALGLREVTINDLLLFAVARTLTQWPELNAWFDGETITQHNQVHLASAVDTPRGLMVPVIRHAQGLSLKQIAREAKRLADACLDGRIAPDELSGGTFTVSNLGAYGIESFTPILNPPQVAILGVGNINLKPVEVDSGMQFVPHLGLSLTINHQVVDGGPGARFLQVLSENLASIELLTAV